jgi:hypothetical protein
VCYSVAISTVFQAYFTTFLIELGYEKPIGTREEMLKSENKFGFYEWDGEILFPNTSNPVDTAIDKKAVHCPDGSTCFIWSVVYHNISTVIKDLNMKIYRATGDWTDENNRPLFCEIEGGVVTTFNFAMRVKKGALFFLIFR